MKTKEQEKEEFINKFYPKTITKKSYNSKNYMKQYNIDNKEKLKEYKKQYAIDNKEKLKEYKKQYAIDNKEYMSKYLKQYFIDNKEEAKEKSKQYRIDNKEKLKEKSKQYSIDNKEKLKEKSKQYYIDNKEKIREKGRLYYNNKYNMDNVFKLTQNIRCRIKYSMKNNKAGKKTVEILGCSFEEFKLHIESKFEPWMNWDNYGNWNGNPTEINIAWDLDHIIPTSSAINEEELLKLNHFSNFQPLCSFTNRYIKRDNI